MPSREPKQKADQTKQKTSMNKEIIRQNWSSFYSLTTKAHLAGGKCEASINKEEKRRGVPIKPIHLWTRFSAQNIHKHKQKLNIKETNPPVETTDQIWKRTNKAFMFYDSVYSPPPRYLPLHDQGIFFSIVICKRAWEAQYSCAEHFLHGPIDWSWPLLNKLKWSKLVDPQVCEIMTSKYLLMW